MVSINRAYKYRLYPDADQQVLLLKTFGCCRFVYNKLLEEQERRYVEGEAHLSYFGMVNFSTRVLKQQYEFLKEPDKFALANALKGLDEAYKKFFSKKGNHPRFKSKNKSRMSYTTNITGNNIAVGEDFIKLPKLGKVKAVIHRVCPAEWKLKSVTISKEPDGSYYASVLYEYEQIAVQPINNQAIGLDYKSDGLYTDSNGSSADMPKYFRQSSRKLGREQRHLSRRIRGSKNYEKQKLKVARVYRHISNQRNDFLHKKSAEIANQYSIVCVENLNMRAMSNKGFGNGKSTLDNGYGKFLNMLAYKLADRGGQLVKVSKWYPSSQICSCCGEQFDELKDLSIRHWICPDCGSKHDRDVNAAINICVEGLRQLKTA